MPRNSDVMEICEFAERQLMDLQAKLAPLDASKVYEGDPVDRPKFDKTSYMRDYMRNRRAKKAGGNDQ